jgi:hypothetical protein
MNLCGLPHSVPTVQQDTVETKLVQGDEEARS